MKYGDPIYFNDTFIINYDEIERKNKILNFKNFVNNKIYCFKDLINTDYFVFDKYIKLETINKIFGLNGICQVMNSLYIIKNNDISNLIKCSNYGKYYNWIIASTFTAIIFMKVNYVYHNIYDIFNKQFKLNNDVFDNYSFYWSSLFKSIELKNSFYYFTKYMMNNCNNRLDFNFILDDFYMLLDNVFNYSILAFNCKINIDYSINKNIIEHFENIMKHIIYLGLYKIYKNE